MRDSGALPYCLRVICLSYPTVYAMRYVQIALLRYHVGNYKANFTNSVVRPTQDVEVQTPCEMMAELRIETGAQVTQQLAPYASAPRRSNPTKQYSVSTDAPDLGLSEEVAAAKEKADKLYAEELAAVRDAMAVKKQANTQLAATSSVKKKRKKRSSIGRRSAKKKRENIFLGDGILTSVRAERIGEAGAILDVLQPYVDALPWENLYGEDGNIISLGRKYQSVFVTARYVAAGWDKLVSCAVAEHIYGVSDRAVCRSWSAFASSEQNFSACMSQRGQHPKLQDLLENVQTQIECRAWLDEQSDMKGGDRSSPQSFARWLNDVQLPAMLVREEASRLKIGLLVSQQHRHKVSIPLHGVSTSLSAASTTLPRAASSSSSPSLSPATVLATIDHVERVTLSEKTAARYMNRLGYTRVGHHKGTFFDGHDRSDVVKDRLLYLAEKLEQDKATLHSMPTVAEVLVYCFIFRRLYLLLALSVRWTSTCS